MSLNIDYPQARFYSPYINQKGFENLSRPFFFSSRRFWQLVEARPGTTWLVLNPIHCLEIIEHDGLVERLGIDHGRAQAGMSQ
jgi:hypothetical protein